MAAKTYNPPAGYILAPCRQKLLMFPCRQQRKYPRMASHHKAIWSSFLADNPNLFDAVAYDVHLGTGAPVPPQWPENYRRMMTKLSQKKADVVALKGDQLYIVEIKQHLTVASPGQAAAYCFMFDGEFQPHQSSKPCVLYQYEHYDIMPVCRRLKVHPLRPISGQTL